MKLHDLYRSVTEQIIRELEGGTPPWLKPWKEGNRGGLMPHNAITGRTYSGINVLILWSKGYEVPAFLTYKQAQAAGAFIRKGERGTTVVFTKPLTVEEDEEEKTIRMLKTFTVFHISQVEGLPAPEQMPEVAPELRHRAAQQFIEGTKAQIRHGGDMACFIPSKDLIMLPPLKAFKGEEHYHATATHELIHWSGAKHRLNRDLAHRFGSHAYAAEELIAEMGAAFLSAILEIEGELQHASYIANWLTLLKEDNRAVFTAAAKASQAVEYLRSLQPA